LQNEPNLISLYYPTDVLTERTQFSLQEVVLTREGVEFIDENGGGAGVRLRKSGELKPKEVIARLRTLSQKLQSEHSHLATACLLRLDKPFNWGISRW
jgi:hypothetical protein